MLPAKRMAEVAQNVLLEDGARALQYAPTEGMPELRSVVADRLGHNFSLPRSADDVLVVTGSQQALDLTGKVFLDQDDVVLCESPTYLAALSAFKAYQPRFIGVPTDDDGMQPGELERLLATHDRVKLIYVIPDFQNPSGRRWSIERRRSLCDLASRFGVPVIEDAPYAELCFEGEAMPPVASFDRRGLVVYLGTFSKIMSPGMRVGWVTADAEILHRYVLVKQGADLHTPSLTQLMAARFVREHDLEAHIETIRRLYRERRNAMLDAIASFLPPEVVHTRPDGGLFLWIELPEGTDARSMLRRSLEHDVAFVPGGAFFADEGHDNTMRLNFSAMPPDRITEGMRRLGGVIADAIDLVPATV
jgi:DNA-binding transcriptional MocR family regulator